MGRTREEGKEWSDMKEEMGWDKRVKEENKMEGIRDKKERKR